MSQPTGDTEILNKERKEKGFCSTENSLSQGAETGREYHQHRGAISKPSFLPIWNNPLALPDSKCKAAAVSHQHWLWGNSHRGWPGVGKAWKHQPFGSALARCLGSPSFEALCPVRRQELRFSPQLAKIKTENRFGVGRMSPESRRVSQSLFSHQKILVRLDDHQKNDTFGHQKQLRQYCKVFSASGLR